MPNPIFSNDDQGQRFETARFDRMGNLQGGGYGYDIGQSQSWNPNAFGNAHTFNAFAATGRMKPTPRGRAGIPTVRTTSQLTYREKSLTSARPGSTSSSHLYP